MYELSELKLIQVSITRHNVKSSADKNSALAMDIDNPYTITELMPLTGAKDGKLFDTPEVLPNHIELPAEAYSKSAKHKQAYGARDKAAKSQASAQQQQQDAPATQTASKQGSSRQRSSPARKSREADSSRADCREFTSRSSGTSKRRASPESTNPRERSSSPGGRHSRRSSHSLSLSPTYTRKRSRSRSVTPTSKRHRSRTPPNLSSRPGEFRPDKGRSRNRHSESRSPPPSRHRRRRYSRESSPEHRRRHQRSSRSGSRERSSRHEFDHHEYVLPTTGPYALPDPTMMQPYLRFHYPAMPFGMPFPPAQFMGPRMMHEPRYYRPKHPLPMYMNRALPKFNTGRLTEGQVKTETTIASASSTTAAGSVADTPVSRE